MKRVFLALIFSLAATSVLEAQVISLRRDWKFHVGDNMLWARSDYDDGNWEKIRVPTAWEDEGFHGYDGFAWYRTRFDGKNLDRNDSYYLNMGYIDDTDEVYLNGTLIGFSGQAPPKFKTAYNTPRKYIIPADLINFEGDNLIAVRVFDAMHGGGIVDGQIGIFTLEENSRLLVDLQGIWQFTRSRAGEKITTREWQKIIVPMPWEHQGHKYDGFGWYKRSFTIGNIPEGEEIVVILGRIDDFDKTYFNGRLIGETNDGETYGESESYLHTRVYTIPRDLIKLNETNTIEILVEDMGNVGGIYEGRIGITTRRNYDRYLKGR